MRIVSFTLYIYDVAETDQWSRYVAGLIESIRTCKERMPDYAVVVMLGDDVLEKLAAFPKWSRALRHALSFAQVHTFPVIRAVEGTELNYMAPLCARYMVLGLYPDADVLAVRDADSPPTQADVVSIDTWRQHCAATHPVLTISLPIFGCSRCGGATTFHKPGAHCNLAVLQDMQSENETNQRRFGTAWGVDERLLDKIIHGVAMCRIDCFHDPQSLIYFTSPAFDIPMIDRLNCECKHDCHWHLVTQPSRSGKRRKTTSKLDVTHCSCFHKRRVADPPFGELEAVPSKDKSRLFIFPKGPSTLNFATYTPTRMHPSGQRLSAVTI